MNKTMENARRAIVENSATEKILEQSGIIPNSLNKKEESVKIYLWDMINSHKINKGYQFGLKRFNRLFIEWENGKTTEKASVIPSVKEISNACKSLYNDCRDFGFFPIVRGNSDGAIIIDCVEWVEGFYTAKKTAEQKEKKAKENIINYDDLIAFLQNADTNLLTDLSTDIEAILKSRVNLIKKSA